MHTAAPHPHHDPKAEGLKQRIKKGIHEVEDDVENTFDAARDDLRDLARSAGRQARDLANSAEESVVTAIKDHPVKSVFAALATGFVLCALVRRS